MRHKNTRRHKKRSAWVERMVDFAFDILSALISGLLLEAIATLFKR